MATNFSSFRIYKGALTTILRVEAISRSRFKCMRLRVN